MSGRTATTDSVQMPQSAGVRTTFGGSVHTSALSSSDSRDGVLVGDHGHLLRRDDKRRSSKTGPLPSGSDCIRTRHEVVVMVYTRKQK